MVQRQIYPNMDAMWADVLPPEVTIDQVMTHIGQDTALQALYRDASAQLPNVNFVQVAELVRR